ncbi:MAG: anhydro-N-acetylmuramic acid kinase [Pseudomonadota bacterium]
MIDVGPGKPIWAVGLMSGTSMDGVDAALLQTDGETVSAFGPSVEISPAYSADHRHLIDHAGFEITQQIEGQGVVDPALRALAEQQIHDIHFAAIAALRAKLDNGQAEAAIGFHGQTVYHAPDKGLTAQLGDGGRLAALAGCPVVWDFRTQDMVAGGEGAPLAPFYHFALAKKIGATQPLVFLNLGGVGNVTWVDPSAGGPEVPGALVAFDTGPANALVNDWMQQKTGQPIDPDGAAAAKGSVAWHLLRGNAAQAYLDRRPPKSLDRNAFQPVRKAVQDLSTEDGAATLTAFSAECVAASLSYMPVPPTRWLICGGGRHNATMMRMLTERLDAPVDPVEAVGLDGDMLEAQAFAYLAVRVLRGLPTSAPSTTGCREPVCGGQISYPATR